MSELPEGWDKVKLGEIAEFEMGQAPPGTTCNTVGQGTVFVKAGEFGVDFPVVREWTTQPLKFARRGDVLICVVGATSGKLNLGIDCAIGRSVAAIRPTSAINQSLLYRQLQLQVNQLRADSTGTAQGVISKQMLSDIQVVVPPVAEQTRIADQLDTLLARIKACHQRLEAFPALLKRFRRAVLDAATTGALTQDWREHNSAPEWTLVALSDIAEVVGGVTKDSKKQSVTDEEVPYLRVANVQRGFLDLSEIKTIRVPAAKLDKLLLEPGDVLFNEGGDLDKLGRGWIWDGQLDRCTFQNHVFRARLRDPSNQPKFISWWGNSRGLDYFIRSGKQTTNLASINKRTLEALPISLPSPEEQKEIVRRVDALLGLAARIEARFESTRTHAQQLGPQVLAKAFRGELVSQSPQDEPASALLQRIVGNQPEKMKATRGRPRINKPEPVGVPPIILSKWSTLPAGAWAAQVPADEHTATAQLTAVLKAWNKPAPQDGARLATLLCLQPRLLTAVLPAEHATQWCRLVGDAAAPLPAQVPTLQTAYNTPWRNAISKMRARGDLIETGSGAEGTWALGPDAARVDTAGWPEGRAGWVVHYLQTHGVEAVLPTLATEVQEFVHAHAA